MQAVLLAGGLGTRLKSVVNDRPKPMADVCGRPFAEYLILELKKNGIKDIIFAIGYKGEMIREYFKNGEQLGVHIEYSYEKEQLGTAGAIKNAGKYINEDKFFVLNADTLYQAVYSDVIELYNKENVDMALVLRKVPDVSRYGSIKMEDCIITGFNEKVSTHTPGLINGGIYLMKNNVLDLIPEGQKISLENEIIPGMLLDKKKIGAVVNEGYFIDIGVPDDYFKFIKDVEKQNIKF